ncbi:lipase family protein [Mucilaginibacter sp. SG564]|uniref:lipase family protein n=1 Tax=Mucilaginibacter sp. SG564 TaxID=2587022 RepID=UPI0015563682|nr:lipase family protein [Mucilaginibacter sp. SG564]NOW94937.1 hypothetical protein [Mucilaginibacter sp. SG564]
MKDQNASVQSDAYEYAWKFLKVAIEFHKDPKNADILSPRQNQYTNFPAGYKLVANIVMNDTIYANLPIPAYYGFIAAETANSKNIVVAIRGTQTNLEWDIDAKTALVDLQPENPKAGKVEKGFLKLYNSLQLWAPGTNVETNLGNLGYNNITMIGHSLGSGIVTLYGAHLAAVKKSNVIIHTLASPHVGNKDFVDYYSSVVKDSNSHRFYNILDKVPNQPQDKDQNYKHVPGGYPLKPDFHVNNTDKCNHSFDTYLYLLEGNSKTAILDLECRA